MGTRPPRWQLQSSPWPILRRAESSNGAPARRGDEEPTLQALGEQGLIRRIQQRVGSAPAWVTVGIGDDAAVLERERNELEVVTTDSLVEHVHFEQAFSSPDEVGHKALAVNLSDLAAMGARPRWALLSLAVPADTRTVDVDALLEGFLALASRHSVALIGGNLANSPGPISVNVTAGGVVHRRGIMRRTGARADDALFVTGVVGAAAAGLGWLRAAALEGSSDGDPMESCARAHRCPEPRVRAGMLLGRNRTASACVDLSDGLADAVRQLARASGVGARVEAEKIPVPAAARAWFDRTGQDPITAALQGGEDYELLIAVPRKASGRFRAVQRLLGDLAVTGIGCLTADPGLVLLRSGREEALPAGFDHY